MTAVDKAKPFCIAKREVWEAYKQVKANRGAAGVDGQSIEGFDRDLSKNLYRIWNRMSSGSYFPPPVRRLTYRKAILEQRGRSGFQRSLTGSHRWLSSGTWSRSWNRYFTGIPMAIGLGSRHTTPWSKPGSVAGLMTGCSTSTSRVSSMRSIGTS